MSTKTKTFDAIKADVRTRMDELAGAAAEHSELKRFWDTVEAAQAITPTRPTQARRTARVTPGAAKIAKRAGNRRGRPAGSGKRAVEVVTLLSQRPGLTTKQIADALSMDNANYLYRVLPDMAAKGVLVKDDGRFSVA
jgi:hypothetical protein